MFENPTIKTVFAAIGASVGYFIGGVDAMMKALLLFMALDYLTGVMCAVLDKSLSSAVGFRGIFKKMMILILAGTARRTRLPHGKRSSPARRSGRGRRFLPFIGFSAR